MATMLEAFRTFSKHQSARANGLRTQKSAAAGLTPIIALVMLVGLVATAGVCAQDEKPATTPGLHHQIPQPRDRRYTIFIPNDYDGQKPVPLVLALHFAGRVTPYFGGEFLASFIRPALDGLGAIIVAPDCTDSDWTRPRSEKDVLELLDRVMKIYAIDRKRALITGYSMGGSGTWYLAARHQDLFTAALIMAGQPESTTAKVNWKIPLYVIHSRADQIIPFKPAENAVEKLKKRGIDVQFVPLDGVTHYQVNGFFAPLEAAAAWIGKAWQK